MCVLYSPTLTYVSQEDPEDTPFTKAFRKTLMKALASLKSSVAAFFCSPGMIMGDPAIEMDSLISVQLMGFQSCRGQVAATAKDEGAYLL